MRPFDFLNSCKDEEICITFKSGADPLVGILLSFDINLNIVIMANNRPRFIRGENIFTIEEAS